LVKALVVSNPDLSLLPQITDRPFFIRTASNGTDLFGSFRVFKRTELTFFSAKKVEKEKIE
jgi:hypothetical protein